jgi:hypothetical protein
MPCDSYGAPDGVPCSGHGTCVQLTNATSLFAGVDDDGVIEVCECHHGWSSEHRTFSFACTLSATHFATCLYFFMPVPLFVYDYGCAALCGVCAVSYVWGDNDCAMRTDVIDGLRTTVLITSSLILCLSVYMMVLTRKYHPRQRPWAFPFRVFVFSFCSNACWIVLFAGLLLDPANWVMGRTVRSTLTYHIGLGFCGLLASDIGNQFAVFWLRTSTISLSSRQSAASASPSPVSPKERAVTAAAATEAGGVVLVQIPPRPSSATPAPAPAPATSPALLPPLSRSVSRPLTGLNRPPFAPTSLASILPAPPPGPSSPRDYSPAPAPAPATAGAAAATRPPLPFQPAHRS